MCFFTDCLKFILYYVYHCLCSAEPTYSRIQVFIVSQNVACISVLPSRSGIHSLAAQFVGKHRYQLLSFLFSFSSPYHHMCCDYGKRGCSLQGRNSQLCFQINTSLKVSEVSNPSPKVLNIFGLPLTLPNPDDLSKVARDAKSWGQ